jgi:hypothetical protein
LTSRPESGTFFYFLSGVIQVSLRPLKIFCFNILILLISVNYLTGQSPGDSLKVEPPGFIDLNRDGLNDRFGDANGDGINDIDHKDYRHHFKFEDKNNDQINDLWIDRDGDGVNDLILPILRQRGKAPHQPWIDRDGDGIQDANVRPAFQASLSEFVLDTDQDGKNDITGLEFSAQNAGGYRYGMIDEETNQEITKFIDKNGDGMHDSFAKRWENEKGKHGQRQDVFIDKDGDGIADDRGIGNLDKNRVRQRYGRRKGR